MAAAELSKYIAAAVATMSHRTEKSRPSDEGDLSGVQLTDSASEEFQGIRKLQINLNDKMADFYDLAPISRESFIETKDLKPPILQLQEALRGEGPGCCCHEIRRLSAVSC